MKISLIHLLRILAFLYYEVSPTPQLGICTFLIFKNEISSAIARSLIKESIASRASHASPSAAT